MLKVRTYADKINFSKRTAEIKFLKLLSMLWFPGSVQIEFKLGSEINNLLVCFRPQNLGSSKAFNFDRLHSARIFSEGGF